MKDKVVFLGVRGSVPVSGEQFVRYGGNTTCIAVTLSDELIILDAGTGLCGVFQDGVIPQDVKNLPILLTHTHIDHIMGFVSCPKTDMRLTRSDRCHGRVRSWQVQ